MNKSYYHYSRRIMI